MGSSEDVEHIHEELIMQAALKGIIISPLTSLNYIKNHHKYLSLYTYIDYHDRIWSIFYCGATNSIDKLHDYNFKRVVRAPILTLADLPFLLDLMR